MTSSQKQKTQETVRHWLRQVLEARGWSASDLAQASGVSKSTVSRALHDDNFAPTTTTLAKISTAAGVPPPHFGSGPLIGFAEEDLRAIEPPAEPGELTPNEFWREVRGLGLAALGILPGDVVRIDMARAPAAGDVVCAQSYDIERGTARTILRLFDPPFLLTRALDPAAHAKPHLVDGVQVKIMGVVTRLERAFARQTPAGD